MFCFGFPKNQGLYDSSFEKDSCGIGMVAHIKGHKSHSIVKDALEVLRRQHHRGAQGFDSHTGDGAGILVQIPHDFFSKTLRVPLPALGTYGVGMVFIPAAPDTLEDGISASLTYWQNLIETQVQAEGADTLAWREVPTLPQVLGESARISAPRIYQFFIIGKSPDSRTEYPLQSIQADFETTTQSPLASISNRFERQLFLIRKRIENAVLNSNYQVEGASLSIPSLSSKTVVYKGLLLPSQLGEFYSDLKDPDFISALAIVHSRFSTNTFPTWALAHPYRYLCHNGEINTVKGNVNWMKARQGALDPIIQANQSDSACLDNAVEFLVQNGRTLPHAMMMLMPEAWSSEITMSEELRGFYEFHSASMEPWDGPAAVCFTDGEVAGTISDRNGLRPCRYLITTDDRILLASEAGVLLMDASQIREKGRIGPGQILLVDTLQGKIIRNDSAKDEVAGLRPYSKWALQSRVSLNEIPSPPIPLETERAFSLTELQRLSCLGPEVLKSIILPMALTGEEPTSSMGNDSPLAIFSQQSQLLFNYFRQMFAQVTNPPIDPIRERMVMSLEVRLGPKNPLLHTEQNLSKNIVLSSPILGSLDLGKIRIYSHPEFKIKTLAAVFEVRKPHRSEKVRALPPQPIQFHQTAALLHALNRLCRSAKTAIQAGCKILILSDHEVDSNWAPIPSLLAVSTLHQYLIHQSLRTQVSLIVESSEPWSTHHFACLLGYGAEAIHPYLALESIPEMDPKANESLYIQAINKGLLKIFSKMGISTVQSYCGAQIFEIVGFHHRLVQKLFPGSASRIEGMGLKEIAAETLQRHQAATSTLPEGAQLNSNEIQGSIHFRAQGETHFWNPGTISKLQQATRLNDAKTFQEFSSLANSENHGKTLRGLLDFIESPSPIPLDEVEPALSIVKRFTTGAMSFGALGQEAHETLAIAMNRIGAKSNSGEGGEDASRFTPLANGDSANSAIKQVASARFGVTAHYLVNAREIQIKMAQGAKPGEGGQLPGDKVDAAIGLLRFSTPGVQLISPPPHHDIYSIEDLAQLIFDLKNVNPAADVSVKLVAEAGVGTIAAGVAKAYADKILISGDSGGTGASPLSSIKHAGGPWELGLAETHQTLVLNGLRNFVRLETDGQLKTGRDVVIAAILGADEFGFSTAPLIVEGCIMMRKCHLNTCPVGIATQDPELRARFQGRPEHVINYFFFIAEEVRAIMARLGIRTVQELIGNVALLKPNGFYSGNKSKKVDISALLVKPRGPAPLQNLSKKSGSLKRGTRRLELSQVMDQTLIQVCDKAIQERKPIEVQLDIQNTDRATGAMLSGFISKKWGAKGLSEDSIQIAFRGSAGQSFGAFLCPGVTFRLEGESNDYVGKGLSGGKLILTPPRNSLFAAENTILIGNTSLFGATSGSAYFNGLAGERFAVRNSGATAVVEGTGDHACEYMTGGIVVILGPIGKNFGAGMSGGLAFIYDEKMNFFQKCQQKSLEIEPVQSFSDQKQLRTLIENHFKYTESPKAQLLLRNWEAHLPRFLKVIPSEYRKALIKASAVRYQPLRPSEAQVHV